ncbi:hypothetical protein NM208_g874 [Fusarium decemcellulare]|uniref:Uncharacterized protein n=1 Tax=Fusarium decemcellulare TaxID=57161 RepID=A0ACC1SY71_9HYPO|nr:hypothetical protein NM208_g874 [Fusarium decemcellulare]
MKLSTLIMFVPLALGQQLDVTLMDENTQTTQRFVGDGGRCYFIGEDWGRRATHISEANIGVCVRFFKQQNCSPGQPVWQPACGPITVTVPDEFKGQLGAFTIWENN